MNVFPAPDAADVSFNSPYSVDLSDGQEATVSYSPQQAGSTFFLAALGVTKATGTVYEVRADGDTIFGPAEIPPTDVDDMTVTWLPCKQFQGSLTVIISNVSGQTRTYHVQPIGFERIGGA